MRFSEFKILRESPEQNKFYTIGDSHAVAVAQAGGKEWVNLAIGGTSSTDSSMLANISKIPKGAVVLVSQGANDTANAILSHKQGRPLKSPEVIASNVAKVVDKVQAQGATVVFLLFPNGPGRGGKDAQHYGGPFQDQVRDAIRSAIGGVPIIDINGKPLYDGIHAGMGTYKEVATEVKTKHGNGITLGPTGAKPGVPATKDKPAGGQGASPSDAIDVPTSRRGPAVRDVQQALLALGYKLPKHGADGIRGPETSAAVSEFQKDNGLTVDGDPGPETVGALNKIVADKGIKIKKSTAADVKSSRTNVPDNLSGNAKDSAGATGSAKDAVQFFISKGWSPEQAAGIVGNLQAESGANLRTDAVGDGGQAYGIAQWHPPRQEDFRKVFGKDIRKSNFKEQLEFIQWELNNTEAKAGEIVKKAKTAEEAAWLFDKYYERSSGAHRQKRINNALALLTTTSTATA
jgi:peptidoglycan hydrolase-like protein with peptidoglycan-binding domain